MSSKRRLRRQQCDRKRAFATEEQAQGVLAWLRRQHAFPEGRRGIEIYQCPHGGHWHIGHRPRQTGSGWRKAVARGRIDPSRGKGRGAS